jgi:DNA-binding response OmpR family regulator
VPTVVIELIVDEPFFRRSLAAFLTQVGYRVEVVATAADGLSLARATRPDLLLLDRTLPGGDGLRLVPVWRHDRPDLPALMVTGDPRPETRAQGLQAVGALHAGEAGDAGGGVDPEPAST